MKIKYNNLLNSFSKVVKGKDGIFYPRDKDYDERADEFWSEYASTGGLIEAVAATPSKDFFTKYPKWFEEYIRKEDKSLLDAGCGYGRLSISLLKKYSNICIVGVDASQVMLNKFAEFVNQYKFQDRTLLYKGNLSTLPIKSNTFDLVISASVLLHLPRQEAKVIIEELLRILKPGGKAIFIASFPNLYNPEGFFYHLYEKVKSLKYPDHNGPVRFYSRKEVTRLFFEWGNLKIRSDSMIVVPKEILFQKFPFQKLIKKINTTLTKKLLKYIKESGILVEWHDVIVSKPF